MVAILGASVMFVAAMMSLSANSQQELAAVHKQVGTSIHINYATNDANNSGPSVSGGGQGQKSNGPQFLPPTPLPNSVVTKVKSVPGVASVQASLSRPDSDGSLLGGTVTAPDGQQISVPLMVNGITSDASGFTIMGGLIPKLVSGRALRASDANSDVALMGQSAAEANHLHVGSTFSMHGTTFTLIGLYTTSNQVGDGSVVIPMAVMQKVFGINGVDSITATAASYEQVNAVAARLRKALGSQFNVVTDAAQYSKAFSALQIAQSSIQVALVISLFIAAAVTVFAVVMLVRERTAEIAILRTLGASHWQVLRQFWTEILAMSGSAAVLAILLLVPLGPFISQRFDIDPASLVNSGPNSAGGGLVIQTAGGASASSASNNPLSNVHLGAVTLNGQTLLIILGVGVGLALLASLFPTWTVSHVKPARVLRQVAA
ncbi:MAG TPA: ABC transporter permease [Ktedonobacterales bacterium]|nr:ABC transporter permease [Ktedonobacterales bacterium]